MWHTALFGYLATVTFREFGLHPVSYWTSHCVFQLVVHMLRLPATTGHRIDISELWCRMSGSSRSLISVKNLVTNCLCPRPNHDLPFSDITLADCVLFPCLPGHLIKHIRQGISNRSFLFFRLLLKLSLLRPSRLTYAVSCAFSSFCPTLCWHCWISIRPWPETVGTWPWCIPDFLFEIRPQ